MVKYLLYILPIFFLGSCSPCLYMAKHCPPTIVKDSIYTEIHDTTIIHDTIVVIKADTTIIHDTVPCGDFKKEFHGKRSYIKVEVKDSVLTAICVCEEIEQKLHWYEHIHKEIMKQYHSEERVVQVKKKTGFQTFKSWWFWITAILIALWITIKILRMTGNFPIQIKRSG